MYDVSGKSPPNSSTTSFFSGISSYVPTSLTFHKTCVQGTHLQGSPLQGYSVIPAVWEDHTPSDIIELKNGIGVRERQLLWDVIKRITNPFELIFTNTLSQHIPPSVCILKPLSRSYFKFVEICELMKFFEEYGGGGVANPQNSKLRSLHLCEGPGGFIEAFLDRAERHKKTVTNVWAMTLKQTHHSIPGWRAAGRLLTRHPQIQVEYGPSGTGNILDSENQEHLEKLVKKRANLVTADGGFDFSGDFEGQEKVIFPLLVASARIALSCLAPNGCFILKIFDSFSEVTEVFLCIVAQHFKDFAIYKPVTSRPCNSERYFIGRGFKGFPAESRDLFVRLAELGSECKWINNSSSSSNSLITTRNYIQTIITKYVEEQKAALSCVVAYDITKSNTDIIWQEQYDIAVAWCKAFHVPFRRANSN